MVPALPDSEPDSCEDSSGNEFISDELMELSDSESNSYNNSSPVILILDENEWTYYIPAGDFQHSDNSTDSTSLSDVSSNNMNNSDSDVSEDQKTEYKNNLVLMKKSFDQKIFGFDQNFKKSFGFGFDQNYLKVRVFDQHWLKIT